MTTVSRTFSVRVTPSVVVPYLADFHNAEEWDPGTVSCTQRGSGPVAVGSSWDNESKIAGMTSQLVYTLEGLSEHQVVLVGRNDTATSTETIDVTPSGTGSEITYTNVTELHGAAKLAAPAVKLVFEKIGNDVVKQLTESLNSLESAASPRP